MPEYLSELVEIVRSKQKIWSEEMDGSINKYKLDTIRENALSHWNPLDDKDEKPAKGVIGTDGSLATRTLWDGRLWWIVRAIALQENSKTRVLDTGFAPARVREQELAWYVSIKMETIEHAAALQALRNEGGEWLLLDGSLFGRLQHLPVESGISNDRFCLLDYFETTLELLQYCRENDIGIIAVSKDSRARHFLRFTLLDTIHKVLKNSNTRLSLESVDHIQEAVLSAKREQVDISALKTKLSDHKKPVQSRIMQLVKLATDSLSDHVLIQLLFRGRGYTSPLVLSMMKNTRLSLANSFREPTKYLRTRFKMALAESEIEAEFKMKATKILTQLRDLPAIVSFHIKLHPQDTPLRVDIPGWMVGIDTKIWEPPKPERMNCNVDEVLSVLRGGYGGLQNYNIWLKRADEIARLGRQTVDNLYRQTLERELGTRIVFERGYSRVYYP